MYSISFKNIPNFIERKYIFLGEMKEESFTQNKMAQTK